MREIIINLFKLGNKISRSLCYKKPLSNVGRNDYLVCIETSNSSIIRAIIQKNNNDSLNYANWVDGHETTTFTVILWGSVRCPLLPMTKSTLERLYKKLRSSRVLIVNTLDMLAVERNFMIDYCSTNSNECSFYNLPLFSKFLP